MTDVTIYCYLIIYWAKQNHLLLFHIKNNELNKLCINNINQECKFSKFKDMSIRNHIYYFFGDIINIESLHPNNIKIDEKSYKNIVIYYIEYVTTKDLKYVKSNSVNILYLIFSTKWMDTLKKWMEIII